MHTEEKVKIWDPAVRVFHWLLVASFFIAYVTEDEWLGLHTAAGYTVLGLIVFRLLWGVVGTRHARFTDFVRRPSEVVSYLRDVVFFRARRYLGHNPAGGAMVIALLLSLALTTLSGLVVYGSEELAGPLAEVLRTAPPLLGDIAEEIHEFFAGFTLFLVVMHVAGVAIASLQHQENLVRSMINGFKRTE